MDGCHIKGSKVVVPWAARPTVPIGRLPMGPNRPLWALVTSLGDVAFVLSRLRLLVGLLIHTSLILPL